MKSISQGNFEKNLELSKSNGRSTLQILLNMNLCLRDAWSLYNLKLILSFLLLLLQTRNPPILPPFSDLLKGENSARSMSDGLLTLKLELSS